MSAVPGSRRGLPGIAARHPRSSALAPVRPEEKGTKPARPGRRTMRAVTGDRDEAAVRALYAELLRAWNERDAAAFAALFADDGAMIGFDGSQATSAEIEGHLTPVFLGHPTARYVAKVLGVRGVGPGAATLRAMVGMIPPGQHDLNPAVNALQSLVAGCEDDGRWRIVLFQTTPAQYHGRPELVAAHTAEIQQVADAQRRA